MTTFVDGLPVIRPAPQMPHDTKAERQIAAAFDALRLAFDDDQRIVRFLDLLRRNLNTRALTTHTHAPGDISPQGAGSGLDADLLDSLSSAHFLARANHTGTQAPATISPQGAASGLDADLLDGQSGAHYLARANHTGTQAPATISPQGAGSGLDADTLDGSSSLAFLKKAEVVGAADGLSSDFTFTDDATFQDTGLEHAIVQVAGDIVVFAVALSLDSPAIAAARHVLVQLYNSTDASEVFVTRVSYMELAAESKLVAFTFPVSLPDSATKTYKIRVRLDGGGTSDTFTVKGTGNQDSTFRYLHFKLG